MKITKNTKRIILAGAVAITISTVITTSGVGAVSVGSKTQQSKSSKIDPPGG